MLKQDFKAQICEALGEALSAQDLAVCLKSMDHIQPEPGQLLWELSAPPSVIYIVLSGRVRLIDPQGNLVLSLPEGSSVGESLLFPEAGLLPYAVRASYGALLGCFKPEAFLKILQRNEKIRQRLYEQAVRRDLLLLFLHQPIFNGLSRSQLWELFGNTQPEPIPSGIIVNNNTACHWLLRKGVLVGESQQRLAAGSLYQAKGDGVQWQADQPTELHRLSLNALEQARLSLVDSGTTQSKLARLSFSGNGAANSARMSGQDGVPASIATSLPALSPAQSTKSQSAKSQSAKVYFPRPTVKLGHWWWLATQRYPLIQQQSMTDCGVACLVMIGRYWGKSFSIYQLRPLANVDRNGASLQGLVTAAESVGFLTRPVKGNIASLAKQSLPAIAHWQGNHYIVVFAIKRNRVIVCDPAIGRRSLSYAQFTEGWTGYTLLLQPTHSFQKAPEAKSDLWRFIQILQPFRWVFVEILLTSLLIQLFGLCIPVFTQTLLDQVVVNRSVSTFFAAGAGLLLFSVFSLFMRSLQRYLLFHTANRIDLSLAVGFIGHALRLPQHYFDTRYVGDITSRIDENRTIRSFLASDSLLTLIDLVMVFVYFGLMFWYNQQLAMIAAILFPILALGVLISTPFLQQISREIFKTKTKEGNYLIEALTGISTIKALGIERMVRWRWEELFNNVIKTNFSGQILEERIALTMGILETTGTRLIFLFGVWQVIHDQMTIGQLFAFNMLLDNIFRPFQKLISLWNDFQEVVIAVERLNDVLNSPPEEDEQSLQLPALPPMQGHIEFQKVTFRYNSESDINTLENISFEVLPGQTVAIVGRSGSGKTTLAKLLLGLYPISSGHILIDGYDLNSISKGSLRRQVGIVDQETFLFGGTIRENIALAYPGAGPEEIREVARQAGADKFINELSLKYETPIGEGGGMLSGGQRQRLAIARALLGNPRLLIFDEATSSLDTESEQIIQNNLNTILQNRTTLIIAHRLSTVRNADLILVLDRGILIERGTHAELMAQRGQYFYLNQQQFASL